MLVISNGAMKSGSTWLSGILMKVMDFKPLPEGFHDARFGNIPTIRPELLQKFLDEVDYRNENYFSKNHLYYEYCLLSRYNNVRVLDIDRDVPDTLISLFFHIKKKMTRWGLWEESLDDIKNSYREFGPEIVRDIVRYHSVWSKKRRWTYLSSYERLKEDPQTEIAAIASFLGVTLSRERIEFIAQETTLSKLADESRDTPGMDVRFRKGIVGDHRNHFDDAIVQDIRRVEAQNRGYPKSLFQKVDFYLQCRQKAGKNNPFPREPGQIRNERRAL